MSKKFQSLRLLFSPGNSNLLWFFVIVTFSGISLSFASPESEELFSVGLSSYNNRDYHKAKDSFLQVLRKHPGEKETKDALLISIDIYLRMGEFPSAEQLIKKFQKLFPYSSQSPRIKYYTGLIHLKNHQLYDAVRMFIETVNTSTSLSIYNQAEDRIYQIVSRELLHEDELKGIIKNLKYNNRLLSGLLLGLAKKQESSHTYKAARLTYTTWLQLFPRHKAASKVKSRLRHIKNKKSVYQTILVMAPITGNFRDIGQSVTEGMLLAFGYMQKSGKSNRHFPQLNYKILDTSGDPVLAVTRLRQCIAEENIIAIIGPVMSEVSTAVAIELSAKYPDIPMITPTATTHGISKLGNNIFQTNVTTYSLAKSISDYAIKCMNMKEFAILAPNTEYGFGLAQSFSANVLNNNGKIIATEYYNPEDKDYAGHYKVIRMRKAKSDLEKAWLEKGLDPAAIPKKELATWGNDSVLSFDGLFIAAANGQEAYKVSSQAHYHKLKFQMLGSSGWHDGDIFHKGVKSALGALISVNFLVNDTARNWKSFKSGYMTKWHTEPNNVSILSYNATALLLEVIQSSANGTLISDLKSIHTFSGVRGNIVLHPEEGFNNSATILKVGHRNFEKVDVCQEMK
ncbi:MAG: penicillin-binding protein activator [Fibrobacteria bacterium]|nr:penicillin-binding protein activator [Fibrobacteria bacterium]